jgi:hypothetical protein
MSVAIVQTGVVASSGMLGAARFSDKQRAGEGDLHGPEKKSRGVLGPPTAWFVCWDSQDISARAGQALAKKAIKVIKPAAAHANHISVHALY